MKNLTLADIGSVEDTKPVEFYVKEWDGSIYIGRLTIQEHLDFDTKHRDEKGVFKNLSDPNLIYDLLSLCIKDVNGNRMFVSDNMGILKAKDAKVVNKIFLKALSQNFMDTKSVDDIKKNSAVTN